MATGLPPQILEGLPRVNVSDSFTVSSDLDLFFHCWRQSNCDGCLGTWGPCSWCAVSQTCVPNEEVNWPFAILAPIRHENICPLGWKERWELRAKPFSCRCSTMTLMSVVVAVLSTLLGVLLIWILLRLVKFGYGKWKKREAGWWRVNRLDWNRTRPELFQWNWARKKTGDEVTADENGEERPLLG